MYKDKEKQREATRERVRRYRKGVTKEEGVTEDGVPWVQTRSIIKGMPIYPDILDKLTDSVWRPKLEKICNAFQSSHHPSYSKDVWLGDTNLSTACDWLGCTS